MSKEPDVKHVRFSLITGKGVLIVFDSDKCNVSSSSGWEVRTSYDSTLSTEDIENFGDLVKDCIAIVNKVL